MSAELVNFLQQVVAGNRDEAANIIKDQLDEIIHDFIFPGDAESDNDFGAAADVDGIDNPFEDQAELPDPDLEGGFEDEQFGEDLDGLEGMEGLEDFDDVAESLDDDDAELLLGSADAEVEDDSGIADVDSEDADLDLDALSDELGDATLSDIEDFDEVDGAAAKTVVAAEVDHNSSDGSVVPVKLIYSDGSDFEFYTLSDSADQVAQVLSDILEVPRNEDDDSDGPSGTDISSLDDLDPSTDVSLDDVFESLTRRKIRYILD